MRISLHIKSFGWLLVVQLYFFLPNFDIFVIFYVTQDYPPRVCPFTTNPAPPTVTCSGGEDWGVQMGGVGLGGGGFMWGGGFRWGWVHVGGMWVQVGGGGWLRWGCSGGGGGYVGFGFR